MSFQLLDTGNIKGISLPLRRNVCKILIKGKKERKKKKDITKLIKRNGRRKKNRVEFDYLEWAVNDRLFTGAVPLLFDAGAFACCVSTLGRFAPL